MAPIVLTVRVALFLRQTQTALEPHLRTLRVESGLHNSMFLVSSRYLAFLTADDINIRGRHLVGSSFIFDWLPNTDDPPLPKHQHLVLERE